MFEPRILENEEKTEILTYDLQFMPTGTTLNSRLRCKECGRDFLYKESVAVELFDVVGFYEMVYCKHYPECKGLRQNFELLNTSVSR